MTRAALMGRRNAIVDVVNDPDSMKKLSSQNIEWIRERLNALNEFLLPTKQGMDINVLNNLVSAY